MPVDLRATSQLPSGLLARLAAAASAIGHLVLLAVILTYAGVRPFQSDSVKAIAVDLVAPDEIEPPKPPQQQEPQQQQQEPPRPPEPDVTEPKPEPMDDLKPSVEAHRPPEPRAPPPASAQPAAAPPAAAAQPPLAAAPAYTPPQPDITVQYGVMLGLPESLSKSDFDAAATDSADLPATEIAAFRRHLRSCAAMPAGVDAADDVWIKLRAAFTTDGHLAAPPALIEGKASPRAIALAHAAIAALQACQPYAMLPPDKYDEWKVLDLEFSPKDFSERQR